MKNIDFAHELINGRIAEMIFEHMLRDSNNFTVLQFGYEKIIPELAHAKLDGEARRTLEVIRRAPDFAVIHNEKGKVYLIEVKYRSKLYQPDLLECAENMMRSWNPSHLFVATPEGFYFDSITKVIENNGSIGPMPTKEISKELQDKYLKQLNEFLPSKSNQIEH